MEAAKRFFKRAVDVVGHSPERVTTDGHDSYPRAIRETVGSQVMHRTNAYLDNRLEQDHRGVKQRYYPMRGFGSFESAARFCCAFDELRNYLRPRQRMGETVSLEQQRRVFRERLAALQALMMVASLPSERCLRNVECADTHLRVLSSDTSTSTSIFP